MLNKIIYQIPFDLLSDAALRDLFPKIIDSSNKYCLENLNDDDFSFENIKKRVCKYLDDAYSELHFEKVFLNVCYSRSAVPSKVRDTFSYNVDIDIKTGDVKSDKITLLPTPQNAKNIQWDIFGFLIQRNIDIIKIAVDYLNFKKIPVFASFRMNDHHYSNDPLFASQTKMDFANEWGIDGSKIHMDYTLPTVRKYFANYAKEVVSNYCWDGVEFDFLRTAPYFSEVNDNVINDFNNYLQNLSQELKDIASKNYKKDNFKIAARVYPTTKFNNHRHGLDATSWVANGTVDILTIENFYAPLYSEMPVKDFKTEIKDKNRHAKYELYAGTEWMVSCKPYLYETTTAAHLRGFVNNVLDNGADGIYLFNWINSEGGGNEVMCTEYKDINGKLVPYVPKKERNEAILLYKENQAKERRYVYSYEEGFCTFPRYSEEKSWMLFSLNTGKKNTVGDYVLCVGLSGKFKDFDKNNLVVYLNAHEMIQIDDVPKDDNLIKKYSNETVFTHISQVSDRVLRFKAKKEDVRDGENTFSLYNGGINPQLIEWFEVFVNT